MSPAMKKSSRRTPPTPSWIASFIDQVLQIHNGVDGKLTELLSTFQIWSFPKGDLFQWVNVLNRFDEILEETCNAVGLCEIQLQPQTQPFSPQAKSTLIAVLRFSTFLLDHCANRSLYSSGNWIDHLLCTTDVEVLEQVMRLSLRLAQRASLQRTGRMHFPLSHETLWSLGSSLQMVDDGPNLPSTSLVEPTANILPQWSNLRFSFFQRASDAAAAADGLIAESNYEATLQNTSSTPTRIPRTAPADRSFQITHSDHNRGEGLVTINISPAHIRSHTIEAMYWDVVRGANLPDRYRFPFMLRLRLCKFINDPEMLKRLVYIHILSLACLAYTVSEAILQGRLFSKEGDSVSNLARLTHTEYAQHPDIMAASFWALEAIAHHRPRLGEVLNAVGASIDHGPLMFSFRKTLIEICDGTAPTLSELIDAQISLLHYLSTTNVAGSMLCSAGLVQLLIDLMINCQSGALRVLVKALTLLDHLVYGFPQAFQIFCESQGIKSLVDRIGQEVQRDIEHAPDFNISGEADRHPDYIMTHERFSLLKTMLKFIVHMMQASGTHDGLRNLIETPLLKSMSLIYQNVPIFGSSVFASTTNIMATFIHNEPSNYQILQEAQLPQLFLQSVCEKILPAAEVLTAIPNAFGAICLNTQGLALFNSFDPIARFMRIFTSFRHCDTLRSSDLAGLLGTSMDELVRHQPSLVDQVQKGIVDALNAISTQGHEYRETDINACSFATISQTKEQMRVEVSSEGDPRSFKDEDGVVRPTLVLHIDVLCQFLEGYLQNTNHTKQFIAKHGIDDLLQLYKLEGLPYDFAKSRAALSLSHVMRLACEADTMLLMNTIFHNIRYALDALESFIAFTGDDSFFRGYVECETATEESWQVPQRLRSIHALVVLISDLYATSPGPHARTSTMFHQIFAIHDEHGKTLSRLGDFHRKVIWEDIKLAEGLSQDWIDATQPKDDNALDDDKEKPLKPPPLSPEQLASSRYRNLSMLRFFLCQIPPCIVPFYQGLTRMLFSNRRSTDHTQRGTSLRVASLISRVLEEHLTFDLPKTANRSKRHSYALMALTVNQMLLCDERNPSDLMTSLLLSFTNGLRELVRILVNLWQELWPLTVTRAINANELPLSEADKARLLGAIQLVLHLFSKLTSTKTLLDSPQTLCLDSKERHRDRPGFIEPRVFSSYLKSVIGPAIVLLWQDRHFVEVPVPITRTTLVVLTQLLDGLHTKDSSNISALSGQGIAATTITTNVDEASHAMLNFSTIFKSDEDWRAERVAKGNQCFDLVQTYAATRSIDHLAAHGTEVVFETADFLLKTMELNSDPSCWSQDTLIVLIGTLQSVIENLADQQKALQLKAIAHLIAILVLNESFAKHCRDDLESTIETLLDIAQAINLSPASSEDVVQGATNILLACDSLLSLEPQPYDQNPEEISDATKPSGGVQGDARYAKAITTWRRLLDLCMSALPSVQTKVAVLSILRILVRLTRDHKIAAQLASSGFMLTMFSTLKPIITECDESLKITFVLVLRHLIESPTVLRQIFSTTIKRCCRRTDMSTYVKQLMPLVLRDHQIFIETSVQQCHLPEASTDPTSQVIECKEPEQSHQESEGAHFGPQASQETSVDDSIEVSAQFDPVGFLLSEIKSTRDDVVREIHKSTEESQQIPEAPNARQNGTFKAKEFPAFLYMNFLLQCLVEVVASYKSCKHAFVKTHAEEVSSSMDHTDASTSQDRNTSALRFFLHELIVFLPSNKSTKITHAQEMRDTMQSWTQSVLVAFCIGCETDRTKPTGTYCSIMLDNIYNAIKETLLSEAGMEKRYETYLAYAELIRRLVNPFAEEALNASILAGCTHEFLAKLMLEKNFVGLLSQILADIDFKYPESEVVLRAVTKPLRTLTKLAMKLTDIASPLATAQANVAEVGDRATFEDSEAQLEDHESALREETPDLYRHSALGLFEAEMHETDEDDYDSDEDEEMYDDGGYDDNGSETGSAVSDEDLEVGQANLHNEHDIEIVVDEDDDSDMEGSDEDTSSDMSGSESDSFSDDINLVVGPGDESDWQDEGQIPAIEQAAMEDEATQDTLLLEQHGINGHRLSRQRSSGGTNLIVGQGSDQARTASITDPLIQDESENESEQSSGILMPDQDFADDEETTDGELWEWTDSHVDSRTQRSNPRSIAHRLWDTLASGNHGGFISRSHFNPDIQIFRRHRMGGLLQGTGRGNTNVLSNPLLSRPSRPDSFENAPGNFNDWIESIEALIGGGAVQVLGDIMRRPPAALRTRGATTTVHLDLDDSATHAQSAPMDRIVQQSTFNASRPQEQDNVREALMSFTPKMSFKRYQDEASIISSGSGSEQIPSMVATLLSLMRPEAITTKNPSADPTQSERDEMVTDSTTLAAPTRTREVESQAGPQAFASAAEVALTTESLPNIETENVESAQIIQIRGHAVNLSGLGIDPEFLQALPEDMQIEVLTQHLRERQVSSREAQETSLELSPEFLEALPAEIRAELMQQEANDRRRRERVSHQAQISTGQQASPDSANFLASLDPALRRVILSEQDDGAQGRAAHDLFSNMIGRSLRPSESEYGDFDPALLTLLNDQTTRPSSAQRDGKRSESVQLLDRQGIISVLRLLFQPTNSIKTAVLDILLNLCSNRTCRIEILSQLLIMFHESTSDSSSVEKTWLSMTRKARGNLNAESPSKSPRKMMVAGSGLLAVTPPLLLHQCLAALSFLVAWNEQVPSFFLMEHELMRKSSRAKSKSRDVISRGSKYAINDLFSLLQGESILKNAELLEPLSSLLSSISRPLLLLRRNIPVTSSVAEDVKMLEAQSGSMDQSKSDEQQKSAGKSDKRELTPPEIPEQNLRMIINLVTADACSAKTFQNTLAAIYHVSMIPGAREVILAELTAQCHIFVPRIEDDLLHVYEEAIKVQRPDDMPRAIMARFSSSNSDQAKFLRLLKTLDYLKNEIYKKLPSNYTANQQQAEGDNPGLESALTKSEIWKNLGKCLSIVRAKDNLIGIATLLLPSIEALMVVCKGEVQSGNSSEYNPTVSDNARETLTKVFLEFTDEHKKILNQMVRNSPSLMSGSFALLTKNSKVLDFDNKRNYFTRRVRDKGSNKSQYPPIQLNIRRDQVFMDSYKELHFKSGNEVKFSKLNIRFSGEEGVDAGGVSREWFQVLARQMFDPNYALFVPVNADRNTYHPNRTSGVNPEHLLFFKFVGRIVGKALYDGRLLDCHFSRPIYCKMLGKSVSLKDMETLDLEYFNSLTWMLGNDITDVISETFSAVREDFGETTIIDLVPNGRNIIVTEQNKQEYVARVNEYRLLESVSEQLEHFMLGFNEIVPAELVSIFNEQEMELLISGLPDIDPDDWRNNTEYTNYTQSSPQIQWFWRAVRSFDDEERARLLQFCTGSSRLPVEGFASLEGMHGIQKFNIHRDYTTGARLPSSHTCFNQLDLPEYDNYELLRSSVLTAISEGNEGFGFA